MWINLVAFYGFAKVRAEKALSILINIENIPNNDMFSYGFLPLLLVGNKIVAEKAAKD